MFDSCRREVLITEPEFEMLERHLKVRLARDGYTAHRFEVNGKRMVYLR